MIHTPRRAPHSTLPVAALACVAGVAPASVDVEVLYTFPSTVANGPLVPLSSTTDVLSFNGQPRSADDGTWYALVGFVNSVSSPLLWTRNAAMVRDGIPYIREGLQIPGTPGLAAVAEQSQSQQPFSDMSIARDGTVAQIVLATDQFALSPDGTPDPNALAFPVGVRPVLLVDTFGALAGGDQVDIVPGLPATEALVEELSIVKAADEDRLLVKADLSDLSGTFAPETTVLFEFTGPRNPATRSFDLLLTDDDAFTVPGLGYGISSMNSNEEDVDYNAEGNVLIAVDVDGAPFDTDGALLFYDALTGDWSELAREGGPSPIAGRNFDGLFNNPLALSETNYVAYLASITGNFADDGLLIVDPPFVGEPSVVVAREGMTVGTASPGPLQLGFANANIEIDNEGNVIWYGAWNTPKDDLCPDNPDVMSSFAIFEGLFFNDRVLIEGGVTTIDNVTINGQLFPQLVIADLPNTGFGGFHVSPDGRFLTFGALVAEPSDDLCTFSINNDATMVAQVVLRVDLDEVRGGGGPCSPADLVPPFGLVDIQDVDAFIAAFIANDLAADLAPPSGLIDIDDVDTFIAAFLAGCP